mgnify:CR=1 FL=1
MSRNRIAIARRLPQPLLDALAPLGDLVIAPGEAGLDREGLKELMANADAALVTALDAVDAEIVDACPKLRLIANIGVGYDNIDVAACTARGITVNAVWVGVADGMAIVIGSPRSHDESNCWPLEHATPR